MILTRRRMIILLSGLFVLLVARATYVIEYITGSPAEEISEKWKLVTPTPGAREKHPPQGLTYANDNLYFTNHFKNRASKLYRLDPYNGEIKAQQMMPEEATHTSGLAFDGDWLWAVDHGSNRLYKIDLSNAFKDSSDAVIESYSTGLTSSSGLTAFTIDNVQYLAISDFVWSIQSIIPLPTGTAQTYIIHQNRIPNLSKSSVTDIAVASFPNGGYSQGLTFDGTYLYESVNTYGIDRINILNINRAIRQGEPVEQVGSFAGPGRRIEDLGTDGTRLWTSDEGTYSLYKLDQLSIIRDRIIDESEQS